MRQILGLVVSDVSNTEVLQHFKECLAADEYDEEKLIIYDPNRKGFYAQRRKYEPIDIRLLAYEARSKKFWPYRVDRMRDGCGRIQGVFG